MTIFELLKSLKKGYWYNVPVNPLTAKDKRVPVNHHHAGSHLVELRNMLVKLDYKVTFQMEKPVDVPIYDTDKQQMVSTPVVKINMELKKQS